MDKKIKCIYFHMYRHGCTIQKMALNEFGGGWYADSTHNELVHQWELTGFLKKYLNE